MDIQSRTDLFNYILLQLGHPVLQQELVSQQVYMHIDDAVQYYLDASAVGSYKELVMLLHIDEETDTFQMPPGVRQIIGILTPVDSDHIMYPVLQDLYNFLIPGTVGGNRYDLVTAYLFQQRTELLDLQFVRRYLYSHSKIDNKLVISPKPQLNSVLAIEYYGDINRDEPGLYSHPWIKRYATELCKYQWGFNNAKYSGGVISGSIAVDGAVMRDNALAELDKLKEELYQRYSEPCDFFVG